MAFSLSSDGDFVLPPPLTKSTTVFPPRSPPRAHDLPTLGSRATAASSAKLSTAPLPLRAKAAPGAAVEIIDIDDSDDDDTREEEAPNDRVTSLPPGHHAHASQAAPRGVMHKTISAPVLPSSRKNAVTGRGGQPARRPLNDSDDSDASLPDLGDIGLGTSATMLWSQPWDASGTVPARLKPDKGKGRQISSSAAPALGAGRVTAASRGGDSSATTDSDDEPVKKKGRVNKTAPAIASGSGSAGTGSRAASALTKEQEREAKKRAKDQEKLEKATQAAIEKERKALFSASNKLISRSEACVEIEVGVSSALLASGHPFREKVSINLTASLTAVSTRYIERAPRAGCINNIITWKRNVTKDWDSSKRVWQPRKQEAVRWEDEATVLVYLTCAEVEAAVETRKRRETGAAPSERASDTLGEIVGKVKAAYGSDYQVFLLLQSLTDKAKAKRSAENAEWQAKAHGGTATAGSKAKKGKDKYNSAVSMDDIETEIVRISMAERCYVVRAETYDQTANWLLELTKDVAHRPYKLLDRAREALLQIDGKLQSSGSGNLKTTYVNQLSCINSVTEHMAVGIAAVYPTWRTLLNAYNACANVREKELMLQDIPVGSNLNGAATHRKIGKAVSEKVYIVLFSSNKNLDLSNDIRRVRAAAAS